MTFIVALLIATPLLMLPEITLRAATVVPPTVLPVDWSPMKTPKAFGTADVPAAFVPIRLPAMRLPVELTNGSCCRAVIETPLPMFPEITFPVTVLLEALRTRTPAALPLGTAALPAALVPTRFPTTWLPVEGVPDITMPP